MATDKEAMVTSRTEAARLRLYPSDIAGSTRSVLFGSGTALLAVGTLVSFDTAANDYVVWADSGADGTDQVQGLVYPNPIQLVSGSEVAGVILMHGEVHLDDIPVVGGTLAQIKTALRAQALQRNISVRALDDVRQ